MSEDKAKELGLKPKASCLPPLPGSRAPPPSSRPPLAAPGRLEWMPQAYLMLAPLLTPPPLLMLAPR